MAANSGLSPIRSMQRRCQLHPQQPALLATQLRPAYCQQWKPASCRAYSDERRLFATPYFNEVLIDVNLVLGFGAAIQSRICADATVFFGV